MQKRNSSVDISSHAVVPALSHAEPGAQKQARSQDGLNT